jgi:hypothetical protein
MRLHAGFVTFVWMLVAWSQLLVLSNATEPARTATKAAVRESFKFDPEDPCVLIPVRVGTKDYQFVLDTGSTVSVFDVSLRSHLGPRVDSARVAVPHGGDMELELYPSPDARVGSLPLTKGPVLCRDCTLFREASGYSIYGLVGLDFLRDWIITIDFDKGRLDVLLPGTERDPNWGESVPFVYDTNGMMFILATVGENVRTAFEVDTGDANTGRLDDSLLTRLVGSNEARVNSRGTVLDLSGIHSARVARLSHLCLGPFRHENLRFLGGNQNALGLNYLFRYLVTIDFPNERLYLAKGKGFAGHDAGNTFGLHFISTARGIVDSVDEKSPAYAAGLRAKDVVVKVCGKSFSAWKPSDISRLLTTKGKTVQVTIERDGKRMEKSFTLKEYD